MDVSLSTTEALPLLEQAVKYRNYAYDSFFTAALAEGYFLADRIQEAVPWASASSIGAPVIGQRPLSI